MKYFQKVKVYNTGRTRFKKGHILSPETCRKISEKLKGKKKCKRTIEHKLKLSLALRGRKLSQETKEKMSLSRKGRPILWKDKISQSLKGKFIGKKSSNWKGGISKITKLIRSSSEYRQWHRNVLKKDNFTCQKCLKRGIKLQAHHIKMFHKIIFENNIKNLSDAYRCNILWDVENGKALCEKCHLPKHKKK